MSREVRKYWEIHQYLESSIVGIYFNSSMVMISSVKPCEMNPKPTDPSQSVKTNWMKSACEDAPQLKSPWLEPTEAQMKFNKNNWNQLNFCHLFQFHEKALVKTISKESTSTRICDDCQRLSQLIGRSTFLQGCLLRASVFLKRHHTFPRQRLELAAAQFTYRASPEYGFS